MKLLEGKVAVITGASRGIGKTIALKFAEQGAHVAFSHIEEEAVANALVDELTDYGVKAKGYFSDASDFAASAVFVDAVATDFGSVDILVNNAGIIRDGLLLRMTEDQWDLVIKVNLKSAFNLTKAVVKYMSKQRSGAIVNISSVVGVKGNAGQANYSASKAGMIGLTKSTALEFGSRNVRCNAIAPGFIETAMTAKLDDKVREEWIKTIPLNRAGTPDDVANVAIFLSSELSSYVTGQVVHVCGGMLT